MDDKFFTGTETIAKIHKLVRTKQPIEGIPSHIYGQVAGCSWVDFSPDKFMVEVKWRSHGQPTISCLFTKTGYVNLLEEIDMSQR